MEIMNIVLAFTGAMAAAVVMVVVVWPKFARLLACVILAVAHGVEEGVKAVRESLPHYKMEYGLAAKDNVNDTADWTRTVADTRPAPEGREA